MSHLCSYTRLHVDAFRSDTKSHAYPCLYQSLLANTHTALPAQVTFSFFRSLRHPNMYSAFEESLTCLKSLNPYTQTETHMTHWNLQVLDLYQRACMKSDPGTNTVHYKLKWISKRTDLRKKNHAIQVIAAMHFRIIVSQLGWNWSRNKAKITSLYLLNYTFKYYSFLIATEKEIQ